MLKTYGTCPEYSHPYYHYQFNSFYGSCGADRLPRCKRSPSHPKETPAKEAPTP